MNKNIYRLDLLSEDATILNEALDAVLAQERGVSCGNHANLVYAIDKIFRVHATKREAVEWALWALWREDSLMDIKSDDTWIAEMQHEKQEQDYWAERADMEIK